MPSASSPTAERSNAVINCGLNLAKRIASASVDVCLKGTRVSACEIPRPREAGTKQRHAEQPSSHSRRRKGETGRRLHHTHGVGGAVTRAKCGAAGAPIIRVVAVRAVAHSGAGAGGALSPSTIVLQGRRMRRQRGKSHKGQRRDRSLRRAQHAPRSGSEIEDEHNVRSRGRYFAHNGILSSKIQILEKFVILPPILSACAGLWCGARRRAGQAVRPIRLPRARARPSRHGRRPMRRVLRLPHSMVRARATRCGSRRCAAAAHLRGAGARAGAARSSRRDSSPQHCRDRGSDRQSVRYRRVATTAPRARGGDRGRDGGRGQRCGAPIAPATKVHVGGNRHARGLGRQRRRAQSLPHPGPTELRPRLQAQRAARQVDHLCGRDQGVAPIVVARRPVDEEEVGVAQGALLAGPWQCARASLPLEQEGQDDRRRQHGHVPIFRRILGHVRHGAELAPRRALLVGDWRQEPGECAGADGEASSLCRGGPRRAVGRRTMDRVHPNEQQLTLRCYAARGRCAHASAR